MSDIGCDDAHLSGVRRSSERSGKRRYHRTTVRPTRTRMAIDHPLYTLSEPVPVGVGSGSMAGVGVLPYESSLTMPSGGTRKRKERDLEGKRNGLR